MKKKSEGLTRKGAEALRKDIRDNWSSHSPSPLHSPPAVVTGNLDSSVIVEKVGRDILGRYADRKNTSVHFVHINTEDGKNPGSRGNYAEALEKKYQRPFIEPAVERLRADFPRLAKRELR